MDGFVLKMYQGTYMSTNYYTNRLKYLRSECQYQFLRVFGVSGVRVNSGVKTRYTSM